MPSIPAVDVERTVEAGVDDVWAVLTDLDHSARVLSKVSRVEVLTPGPFGVGTTWRETRRILGREATETMTVTEVDPPRGYVVTAESGGTTYRSTFRVTPRGPNRTDLRLTFGADAPESRSRMPRLVRSLSQKLGTALVTRQLRADLDDIARAARRRPSPG